MSETEAPELARASATTPECLNPTRRGKGRRAYSSLVRVRVVGEQRRNVNLALDVDSANTDLRFRGSGRSRRRGGCRRDGLGRVPARRDGDNKDGLRETTGTVATAMGNVRLTEHRMQPEGSATDLCQRVAPFTLVVGCATEIGLWKQCNMDNHCVSACNGSRGLGLQQGDCRSNARLSE